ncbi:perosamine synthetase [Methylobacterium sp. 275MFSha3.1]|uniref:DegT/DnrJ/EryC1/StrS family aminotransferase n=1 Tax=Methylobacterium sp. 275MFSha3.1 TaxID=1502746 RepID=UPI0008A7E801|nr:DegT/DnrJ/EryC1/StrS family aminotransferase [Methylobacterium sp. 275MFSha3.1]SEI12521.1 perosamine synthetase [Methylobacterium sp. 275MFSha3.1]
MSTRRIPIAGPSITDLEIGFIMDAAKNGWYDNAFEHIGRFESEFASHTKRQYAISLPSCTAGLHLALAALDIGPGDEVIVPDCTWIASSAPISYVGATPVFADISRQTWCMSPDSFSECITKNTKAAVIVNLYGHMAEWDAITEIAERNNIFLIEDAAEAVGSTYGNRPAGSFGLCSAFSFHGSKTMTTGEGGMLVCDDKSFYDKIMKLRDHGRAPGDVMFNNDMVAYKYKMSPLQAALGSAQLQRLPELVSMKRAIFGWYKERLDKDPRISLNPDHKEVYNSYWMSTAILDPSCGIEKGRLVSLLRERGVDVRPFFNPLSLIPAYYHTDEAAVARTRNRVAQDISATGINLPSALSLTESDIDRVAETLVSLISR